MHGCFAIDCTLQPIGAVKNAGFERSFSAGRLFEQKITVI
jgi:hypothetical protein